MNTVSNESIGDVFKKLKLIFGKKTEESKERTRVSVKELQELEETFLNDRWLNGLELNEDIKFDDVGKFFVVGNKLLKNIPTDVKKSVDLNLRFVKELYVESAKLSKQVMRLHADTEKKFSGLTEREDRLKLIKDTISEFNKIKLPTSILRKYNNTFFDNLSLNIVSDYRVDFEQKKFNSSIPKTIKALSLEDLKKCAELLYAISFDHEYSSEAYNLEWIIHDEIDGELEDFLMDEDLYNDYMERWSTISMVEGDNILSYNFDDLSDSNKLTLNLFKLMERSVKGYKKQTSTEVVSVEGIGDIFKGIRKIFADKKPGEYPQGIPNGETIKKYVESLRKTYLNDKWLDLVSFRSEIENVSPFFVVDGKLNSDDLLKSIEAVIARGTKFCDVWNPELIKLDEEVTRLHKEAIRSMKNGDIDNVEKLNKKLLNLKLPIEKISTFKNSFFNNSYLVLSHTEVKTVKKENNIKSFTVKGFDKVQIKQLASILIEVALGENRFDDRKHANWLDWDDDGDYSEELGDTVIGGDYYDRWYFQRVWDDIVQGQMYDILDSYDLVRALSSLLEKSVIGPKDKISNESFKGDIVKKNLNWVLSLEDSEEKETEVIENQSEENVKTPDVETTAEAENEEGVDEDTPETNVDDMDFSVAVEDYTRLSGDEGGKVIDGQHYDEVSGTYKRFVISGFDATTNQAAEAVDNKQALVILLQNGLVKENGLNGVTVEDLLIVCENIMEGYQSTKFNCEENQVALESIQNALGALRSRLQRRSDEGTLDTHEVDNVTEIEL